MLNTGRYLWTHNNLINFIVSNVDEKFQVYSDLPAGKLQREGPFIMHSV